MDRCERGTRYLSTVVPLVDFSRALNQSGLIHILFIIAHANDFVVGWEEGDGHADDQGEEAPSELLLNEEEFKSEHHKEQTADV